MILQEGGLIRVKGQGRKVFRVTRIKFNGELDCVDGNGMLRTFLTSLAIPAAASTDVAPPRSGHAAPVRRGR